MLPVGTCLGFYSSHIKTDQEAPMVLPRSLITPLASELSKFSLSPLSPHQHKGENVVCKGLFSTIFSYSLMISLIPWLLQSSPKSTFSADWNVRLWDITTRVFHCVLNSASPAVSHWARPACRSTKPALYKTSCFIWCHPPNLQDKRPYNYIQCLSLLSFLCSLMSKQSPRISINSTSILPFKFNFRITTLTYVIVSSHIYYFPQ